MILPTNLFEMGKSFTQIARAISLEQIGNLRRTIAWRSGNKDMNMIQIGFQGEQNESVSFTTCCQEVFCRFLYITCEYLAPILGNPHEMIGDGIVCPSCFTLLHTILLLCYHYSRGKERKAMETVRIFPLRGLSKSERLRLRDAQMEAARVWMYCVERHRQTRAAHQPWPTREDLQRETKGGQYALQSQSIQMVTHQFLANVETIAELRKTDKRHRYPYHPKKYLTVEWPAQAISRHGNTLILPMGRGRKSFTCHLAGLPEQIGAVSLVWNGGYELHIVVPTTVKEPPVRSATPAQATVDLGEIHLAAVTTTTGKGMIVTGREIRSLKRQQAMSQGEIQRLLSRCQKGSRRYRKLCYALERINGQTTRQVRDLRHKATRQVVDFCQQEGVQTVFIGN